MGEVRDLWKNEAEVPAKEVDEKEHATTLFSRKAVKVIEEHSARGHAGAKDGDMDPLFLYLAYSAPHAPLQADEKFMKLCSDVPNRHRRTFCAMMAQLDEGIGNVTASLKAHGMWEDTVVVFTSDNGGYFLVGGFNYNYRGGKSGGWEGGVRVPAFIRAPKRYNFAPRDFRGMAHAADWMPTLMGMATGREEGRERMGDGYDLRKAFRGDEEGGKEKSPRNEALLQLDIFQNTSAYRSGCFKLLLGCPGITELSLEPTETLWVVKDEEEEEKEEGEEENGVRKISPFMRDVEAKLLEWIADLLDAIM